LRQTLDAVGGAVSNTLSNVAGAASNDASNDSGAAPQASTPDEPSIETPLHHLYCVEYARLRSGLEIFGDAKTWWQHAENIYARFTQPASDAVMVFAGSKRIARGHVAVVTRIVSPREIRVDQANWQNHGEIDHNTPVLDVSAQNDWSKVRVWDMRSNRFGARVYAIKGFVGRSTAQPLGT
jgi:surface antigen